MQKWEYLTIQMESFSTLGGNRVSPRLMNDQELKDWKKLSIHKLISQLGVDGWEMTGTYKDTASFYGYIFFKRPKP